MSRLSLALILLAAAGNAAAQSDVGPEVPDGSPNPAERTVPIPLVAPESRGSISLGASHSNLSKGQDNWDAGELRLVMDYGPYTWYAEIARRRQFGDQGTVASVGMTYVLDPDWYVSGFFSASDGGFFLPQRRVDLFLNRKWLPERNLITTVGFGRSEAKDEHRDNILFLGLTYYATGSLIFEGGVRINRSNPGEVDSARPFVAATWGEAKHQYLSLRHEWGREAYQLIGPGTTISDFRSHLTTVGWRRWLGANFGFQIAGEAYKNPNYGRYGLGLAFFQDF